MDYKKRSRALVPYTKHPDINKTACMPTLGPTLETPVSKTNLPGPSQIKELTPKEHHKVKFCYSLLRGESLIGSNGLTGNAALLTTLRNFG